MGKKGQRKEGINWRCKKDGGKKQKFERCSYQRTDILQETKSAHVLKSQWPGGTVYCIYYKLRDFELNFQLPFLVTV